MRDPPWVLPVGKRGHLKGLQQAGRSQGSKDRAGLSAPLSYSNLTGTHRRPAPRFLSPVWDGVWAADGSHGLTPVTELGFSPHKRRGSGFRRTEVCCCFSVLAPGPRVLMSRQEPNHFSRGLLPRPGARTHVWSDPVNSHGGKCMPGRAQPGRGCPGTWGGVPRGWPPGLACLDLVKAGDKAAGHLCPAFPSVGWKLQHSRPGA